MIYAWQLRFPLIDDLPCLARDSHHIMRSSAIAAIVRCFYVKMSQQQGISCRSGACFLLDEFIWQHINILVDLL